MDEYRCLEKYLDSEGVGRWGSGWLEWFLMLYSYCIIEGGF